MTSTYYQQILYICTLQSHPSIFLYSTYRNLPESHPFAFHLQVSLSLRFYTMPQNLFPFNLSVYLPMPISSLPNIYYHPHQTKNPPSHKQLLPASTPLYSQHMCVLVNNKTYSLTTNARNCMSVRSHYHENPVKKQLVIKSSR